MRKNNVVVYLTNPWSVRHGKAICPVTMITEGVHHGSHGPIFWPAQVLEKNTSKWKGIPVVINHPTDNDGKPISVRISKAEIIGYVQRPRYCSIIRGIKAEIEIPSNHPQLSIIQNIREVSVGVFSTDTETFGRHNGEQYSMSAISMEPDHLALLTDARGACSWEDGCGLRANTLLQQMATEAAIYLINQSNGDTEMKIQEPMLPVLLTSKGGNHVK